MLFADAQLNVWSLSVICDCACTCGRYFEIMPAAVNVVCLRVGFQLIFISIFMVMDRQVLSPVCTNCSIVCDGA